MKAKPNTQKTRTLTRTAAITIAAIVVIGAGGWLIGRHNSTILSTLADPMRWPMWLIGGLIVAVFLVILLHSIHEEHVINRTVAESLRGRPPMTDEEFGRRYYANDLAPLAAQLKRMLAENLGCDLSGMVPSDDFEKWLYLFPGPDSAADCFFEELAIEFQLTRDCPWPERFGSFDALVKFVAEHAYEPQTH